MRLIRQQRLSSWLSLFGLVMMVGGEVCEFKQRQAITRCAQSMYDIGAFRPDADSQTFTWDFFAKQSRQHFHLICRFFRRFSSCVEPFEACFEVEPVKSHYKTAMVVLNYLCGDGYAVMTQNFECYAQTLSQWYMKDCRTKMETGMEHVDNIVSEKLLEEEVCRVLGKYMDCMGLHIRRQCGQRAWNLVYETVERPTRLVMPQCRLKSAAGSLAPSLLVSGALLLLCLPYF